MEASTVSSTSRAIQWTARVLGSLVVLLFVVFLIGEGPPVPTRLIPLEKLTVTATFMMLLGLAVAWRWPLIGGTLAVLGFGLLAILDRRLLVAPPFAVAGFSGCLHLAYWWLADSSFGHRRHGLRILGITGGVLGIFVLTGWIWLSVGAGLLEERVSSVPQIAGRWTGTSLVSDTLVKKRPLDLDITILPDGTFEGHVGDAVVLKGHVQVHLRGRLGYLENKMGEPPYVMVLDLNKPPLATPRPAKPTVSLCFDVRGEQLIGAIHATDGPEDLRDLHAILRR